MNLHSDWRENPPSHVKMYMICSVSWTLKTDESGSCPLYGLYLPALCKSVCTHKKVSFLWCGQIQKSIVVPVDYSKYSRWCGIIWDMSIDIFSWYLHIDMQWWWSLFLQPSSHTVRLSSSSMSNRQIGHICSSSSFILVTREVTQIQF